MGTPIVHVEDAFVGILAFEGGVEPIQHDQDAFLDPPLSKAAALTSADIYGKILVHRMPLPWTESFGWLTMTCDCSWAGARVCAPRHARAPLAALCRVGWS